MPPSSSSSIAPSPTPFPAASPPNRPRTTFGAAEAATLLLRAVGLLLVLAVVGYFAVRAPSFLAPTNLGLIVAQSAVLGTLGVALTLVLVTGGTDVVKGGIDLSLAGTLGLSAAIFAGLNQAGFGDAACICGALGAGLTVGVVNAVSIVALGILPLLATLAVMNVCAGLELVITENTTIPASSPLLDWLGLTGPFDVPVLGYVLLVLTVTLVATLRFTSFGLRAYAVGGYPEAARAAGIATTRYVAGSYIVSGLLGGLAGILSVATLNGATGGSADMLLPVIATAFLGFIFSRRLIPTIGGTLLATLFLGSLANGFQLIHASTYWVNGIEGVLILAVVGATAALTKGHRR